MIGGRQPSLVIFDLDNTLADREWFFNEWARGSNNRCISGTKRDERRASPPAFVTPASLGSPPSPCAVPNGPPWRATGLPEPAR